MSPIDRIKKRLRRGSLSYWVLSGLYRHPLKFLPALLRSLICTKRLCGSVFPVKVRISAGQRFEVKTSRSQRVRIDGILYVDSWYGLHLPSSLSLASESALVIAGELTIGPGVQIIVFRGASLVIGGRRNSTGSGITCNTRIMVEQSVSIGCDCIIAWDVLITDSDWHDIDGRERCSPVAIGDNVWISHGASVLKGSVVPSGCIVGAKSMLSSAIESEDSLVAGNPARVRRTGVKWSR